MRCDGWEQLLVMGWRWALAEHMAKPAHRRAQNSTNKADRCR